jgi:hypothetical protein
MASRVSAEDSVVNESPFVGWLAMARLNQDSRRQCVSSADGWDEHQVA